MRGIIRLVADALAGSFVGGLPPDLLEELTDDARLVHVEAGTVCVREGQARFMAIVISGVAREYISSDQGRQLDERELHPGDATGITALPNRVNALDVQALAPCDLLRLEEATLLRLVASNHAMARAVAIELSRRTDDQIGSYRARAFGPVRQRLARHLLSHAKATSDGRLVFRASRQEIADAIGTSRRFVLRLLAELRADGTLELDLGLLVVADPARLGQIARGRRNAYQPTPPAPRLVESKPLRSGDQGHSKG